MRIQKSNAQPGVGFQIAPMIDVVFVILVFFMAMAAQIRIEQLLRTTLPGVAASGAATEFADEQVLQIDEAGAVSLNDEVFDPDGSPRLPQLTATLVRMKASSDAARAKLVVTLASHPESAYGRTIDVLNALAAAGVVNVTFTAEAEP